MEIRERKLEDAIETALLRRGPDDPSHEGGHVGESRGTWGDYASGGFRRRTHSDYDRALCVDPDVVLDFIQATQPKEWEAYTKQHGADARSSFIARLDSVIRRRGTLDVLRRVFKANGSRFRLAYFKPNTGLNAETRRLYDANILTVVRQLHYSEKNENSLDLAIFLNGLPLFTAELKEPFTGQSVRDAVGQYLTDRDPREPLFARGRCLAHFAVDPDRVMMTTHLRGAQTRFLPFDKGRDGGAGNPPSRTGFATAYLWDYVWSRESVLELVQHFIHEVDELDDDGSPTGERFVIFPRYHQLEAVRKLVGDARTRGTGQRYLIQHSAGSGKSNTISWLAHRLSVLHDALDKRVFDSIIIVSDRRVIDKQLSDAVQQFEQTPGIVEHIDKGGKHLREALEEQKTIIVSTIQKFSVIAQEMGELPGTRFAVIIDEAHSSQSGGKSPQAVKQVLRAKTLEEAEQEDVADVEDTDEDRIAEVMRARGPAPNVSYFAFTATPKNKTLELFCHKKPDGTFEAFHLYTMRQAIDEGFILDVLQHYTTYRAYWNLLKKIESDPRYDRKKAQRLLRSFVELHDHSINTKMALIVDHFVEHVYPQIGGRAKAMIVTRSRLHAVRYRRAIDAYLREQGQAFKALVAFSGTVEDGGIDYTEPQMNGFPERQTAGEFKRDEYRLLIVANKFQTGFDQPLLHTMYVDKKLGGVNAVQTLSRLNRIYPPLKENVTVLDFANQAEDIEAAFAPYYDRTILREATDPNRLYDLESQLAGFHLFAPNEPLDFGALYFGQGTTQDQLHNALQPVVDRFREVEEATREEFRSALRDYVRLYGFLSQIVTFVDADLERLYQFARLLLRKLPIDREQLPVEIQQAIDIESYRLQEIGTRKIKLKRGEGELEPVGTTPPQAPPSPAELEPLSQIIKQLNERFGTEFSEADKVAHRLEQDLCADEGLAETVRRNPPENARLTFDIKAKDRLQDLVDEDFAFYKKVTDDAEFQRHFLAMLFERYRKFAQGDQPSQ